MRKYTFVLLVSLILFSCKKENTTSGASQKELDNMERIVRLHIINNDIEKNLKTDIEYLRPISLDSIPTDKRIDENDVYVGRVYLVGKSSYLGSSRIYNMKDTMICYFNKDMKFLRWDKSSYSN